MEDFKFMQLAQPLGNLKEHIPDILLLKLTSLLFMLKYFLEQIPTICILHYYAEIISKVP
jgi:hypothetical protein